MAELKLDGGEADRKWIIKRGRRDGELRGGNEKS